MKLLTLLALTLLTAMLASAASWDGQKTDFSVVTMDQTIDVANFPVSPTVTGPYTGPQHLMWLMFVPTNPAVNFAVVTVNYRDAATLALKTATQMAPTTPGTNMITMFFADIKSSQVVGTPNVTLQVVRIDVVVSEDIPVENIPAPVSPPVATPIAPPTADQPSLPSVTQ
jgi:hypothetical protein